MLPPWLVAGTVFQRAPAEPSWWTGSPVQKWLMPMPMAAPDVQHHLGIEQRPGPHRPGGWIVRLRDNTATAVTTAESWTVAAGTARQAAAVVGNVVATPHRRQASVGQS